MLEQPYWQVTAPRPSLSLDGELPARTDVAVIGGGYTGVSAARALARRGLDVTLLEAETLGWGARYGLQMGDWVPEGAKGRPREAIDYRVAAWWLATEGRDRCPEVWRPCAVGSWFTCRRPALASAPLDAARRGLHLCRAGHSLTSTTGDCP